MFFSNFDTILLMVQKSREKMAMVCILKIRDVDDRNSAIKDKLLNWCSPDF